MIQSERSGLWLPREYVIGEVPLLTTWQRALIEERDAYVFEWSSPPAVEWEKSISSTVEGMWDNAALEPGTLDIVEPPQCRYPPPGGPKRAAVKPKREPRRWDDIECHEDDLE